MSYSAVAAVACGSDLPIINITGGSGTRIRVYEWILGFSSSPADIATKLMFERTTDAGTGGTALTEGELDPANATPVGAAVKGTYSTPPTDSDELMLVALNQRATHRWIARQGSELISVMASANGIMLNSESSGGTPTLDATIKWKE